MRLIATKPMRYATRRLMAEDPFYAPPAHAAVLVKLKRARYPDMRDEAPVPPMPEGLRERVEAANLTPPSPGLLSRAMAGPDAAAQAFDHDNRGGPGGSTAPEPTPALSELRREYTRITGKRFFAGWDEDALRQRIAAASAQ